MTGTPAHGLFCRVVSKFVHARHRPPIETSPFILNSSMGLAAKERKDTESTLKA